MLKNNGLSENNNPSPYANWFTKDAQELKRGGTAPIMNSRKNRPPVSSDAGTGIDMIEQDIPGVENGKNIPIITTSYGSSKAQNPVKVVANPSNEGHKITKIFTNSGVSAYRLTKRSSVDESSQAVKADMMNQNIGSINTPSQKIDKSGVAQFEHQEGNQKDFIGASINFTNFGGVRNIASNRPQTSHYKGNGAFRRGRILNESSQNFEEYQTPNTGNLELESLHLQNLNNNQSPDKNANSLAQRDYKPKQNSMIKNNYEQKVALDDQLDPESDELRIVKPSADLKRNEEHNLKKNDNKPVSHNENIRTKVEPTKITRLAPTEGRYNKAKQIMEGRRYAEDIQTFSIVDNDENSKKDPINNLRRNSEKKNNDSSRDDLVSMIGRSCRDNTSKKNEIAGKHENEMNVFRSSPQKFSLDHGELQDVESIIPYQTPGQRPPARKNGQAMNLNERCTVQNEKKSLLPTPTAIQQVSTNVRPPSRHKIPNKALGLEEASQNKQKDPFDVPNEEVLIRRDQPTGKSGYKQSDDLGTGVNNDFDNMNFNNVLDISDFLDGEEQAPDLRRPNTSFANQRSSLQSSQGSRPRMDANKRVGLQSAKPKTNIDNGLRGPNNQFVNKVDSFEKNRGAKNPKETKIDNSLNPTKNNKAKAHSKMNNDLEGFDVLHFESESGDSDNSLKKKRSMLQSAKPALGGSPQKNDFLGQKPCTYKDKKSKIVFIYNKESHTTKKENIDLPFETTLEKDFVGLFAN